MTIYINCRSQQTLHPEILNSIQMQTMNSKVVLVQSQTSPTRLSLLADCHTQIAIFLDEDIVLPRVEFLQDVKRYFDSYSDIQFLIGPYLSSQKAGYLQKGYNWLTNTWTQPGDKKNLSICNQAPGGFWAVRSNILSKCDDWVEPVSWGGEDSRTIQYLQTKGIKIYSTPDLGVLHYPRSHFPWFLRRAFMQGQAKQRWNLGSKISSRKIIREIFSNVNFLPVLLLHQCFVVLGSITERIKSKVARLKPTRPEIK